MRVRLSGYAKMSAAFHLAWDSAMSLNVARKLIESHLECRAEITRFRGKLRPKAPRFVSSTGLRYADDIVQPPD